MLFAAVLLLLEIDTSILLLHKLRVPVLGNRHGTCCRVQFTPVLTVASLEEIHSMNSNSVLNPAPAQKTDPRGISKGIRIRIRMRNKNKY